MQWYQVTGILIYNKVQQIVKITHENCPATLHLCVVSLLGRCLWRDFTNPSSKPHTDVIYFNTPLPHGLPTLYYSFHSSVRYKSKVDLQITLIQQIILFLLFLRLPCLDDVCSVYTRTHTLPHTRTHIHKHANEVWHHPGPVSVYSATCQLIKMTTLYDKIDDFVCTSSTTACTSYHVTRSTSQLAILHSSI